MRELCGQHITRRGESGVVLLTVACYHNNSRDVTRLRIETSVRTLRQEFQQADILEYRRASQTPLRICTIPHQDLMHGVVFVLFSSKI